MTREPEEERKRERSPALPAPSTSKDGEWQTRITKAKQARAETQALRRGKSATFPVRRNSL